MGGRLGLHIGHINLSVSFNGAGEHFVRLIESLQLHSMQQYVLVRNAALAKRLSLVEGVTVGPVVRSAIAAYSLMPAVDVIHIHDTKSSSAGLLFTLTRAVPFVITRHNSLDRSRNPIDQAAIKRASGFIDENQIDVVEHLQAYRRAVDTLSVPTMFL